MTPAQQNKCLALQSIKLKTLLGSALYEKDKSFFFRIDDGLNSDFEMLPTEGWFGPLLPEYHYWIPTPEQIELILREAEMKCRYGSIPESTPATYHYFVSTHDSEAEMWNQEVEGKGFFKEHAYMDLFIQIVKRNPKRIDSAITRVVEKGQKEAPNAPK